MKTSTTATPKPPSPLKILLIGDPGSRKTTFALQFPEPYVLDCDHNLDGPSKAVRQFYNKDLSFAYDDARADDKSVALDIAECYDRVLDLILRFGNSAYPDYSKPKTFILDSLSHVNEFIIRKVLKLKSKSSMEIQNWTDFASAAYTILVARLDRVTASGKTVVCTAHLEKVSQPDPTNIMLKKVVEINPLFSGRVGDSIGAFFTDVWLLRKVPAPAGKVELKLVTDCDPKCSHLKNSVGLPAEVDVSQGFKVLEPFLKGRI